jgi:ABC-type molybdate transport system substrate-binding protein
MLKPGIDDLVKSFSNREGVLINTIYAGCGIHVAEMKALKKGQPTPHVFPDAYFACDVSFMKQVQEWFEASKIISRNDMVLVVPKGNPKKIKSLEDLAQADLKIGLGHPKNSALGALTDDLLKKLRLHTRVYANDRKYPIVHKDAGHDLVKSWGPGRDGRVSQQRLEQSRKFREVSGHCRDESARSDCHPALRRWPGFSAQTSDAPTVGRYFGPRV